MMSERTWHVNKKFLQILFRATVVSLLVFTSIGCYFAAERNSKQYGDYKDLDVANVKQPSMFGKYQMESNMDVELKVCKRSCQNLVKESCNI